jgi:excisionase family DNA binding protein
MGIPEERLLLSRADAAAALAISTDTLQRLIKKRELGVVRIGRSVLVPHDDVLALIERRRGMRRRRTTPTCSRCRRRIAGPRLVVAGAWVCSACVYELEHGGDRAALPDTRRQTDG